MQYADYSAARFTGAQLKAAGFGGSIRYLGTPGRAKNATRTEVQSHLSAGLFVAGVYENTTQDWATGFGGGVKAARGLLADANACGVPATSPLFVAADMHLTGSQCSQFRQYVLGAKTVLGGRTGAYGFSEAIDAVDDIAPFLWQCGSKSAVRSATHLWQRNDGYRKVAGVSCDINEVLKPLGAPIAEAAITPPFTGDDDTVFIACEGYDPKYPKDILYTVYSGGVITALDAASVASLKKSHYNDMVVWFTPTIVHQLAAKSGLVAKAA